MADNKTFGVKVPEELHIEATELMKKLNLTGEGFLNELINVYKSEKAKEDVPVIAEDLKELQAISQRISGIYLNMAYRIDNINKAAEQEKQEQLTKKDSQIYDLQDKNSELNQTVELLTESFNTSCKDKEKLVNDVNQLTDNINNIKALVEEYKSKNDMLLGDLAEYKQYKVEIEDYKQRLNDTELKLKGTEMELEDFKKRWQNQDIKIQNLKEEHEDLIAGMEKNHAEEINKLELKHENAIEQLENKFEFEKDKALLDAEKENQKTINQLKNKHNKEIEEYQNKYKQLLQELEQVRKNNTETKTKTDKDTDNK